LYDYNSCRETSDIVTLRGRSLDIQGGGMFFLEKNILHAFRSEKNILHAFGSEKNILHPDATKKNILHLTQSSFYLIIMYPYYHI